MVEESNPNGILGAKGRADSVTLLTLRNLTEQLYLMCVFVIPSSTNPEQIKSELRLRAEDPDSLTQCRAASWPTCPPSLEAGLVVNSQLV